MSHTAPVRVDRESTPATGSTVARAGGSTSTVTSTDTGAGTDARPAGVAPAPRRRLVTRDHLARGGLTVGTLLALITVWWAVTTFGGLDDVLFPGPGAVWEAFVHANTTHPVAEGVSREIRGEYNYFLWEHLLVSLQRIGAGVGLAILVGVPLGLVMATVRWVSVVVDPYLNFLRALPPLAYVGLLIVWFGVGDISKIWLLFLAAFPPIALATISGVRGVKQDQVHAVRTLGATRLQTLTRVLIPATLPELITGVRVAVGFAWTTVVAAEIINGIPGIGGLAYLSGTQNKSALVVACIVIIGLTAVVLDSAIRGAERLLVPWRGKA